MTSRPMIIIFLDVSCLMMFMSIFQTDFLLDLLRDMLHAYPQPQSSSYPIVLFVSIFQTDFLLVLLRDMLHAYPQLRVILIPYCIAYVNISDWLPSGFTEGHVTRLPTTASHPHVGHSWHHPVFRLLRRQQDRGSVRENPSCARYTVFNIYNLRMVKIMKSAVGPSVWQYNIQNYSGLSLLHTLIFCL